MVTNYIYGTQAILRGKQAPIDSSYSEALANVISSCLQTNPELRPKIGDVYKLDIVQHHLAKWNREKESIGLTRPPTAYVDVLPIAIQNMSSLRAPPSSESAINDICNDLRQLACDSRVR